MALKFRDLSFKNNAAKFTLAGLAIAIVIVLAIMKSIWLAWPIIFILYIVLSLFNKNKTVPGTAEKQTVDLTV
jgi:CDP-diacylglycerol---serine O-phosphatidyltransferase